MVSLSIVVLEAAAGVLLSWVDVGSWSGAADLSCAWQWSCKVDRSTKLVCHIHDEDVGPNFAATCSSGHTAHMWSLLQQSQALAHPLSFPLGIVNTIFNSKNHCKSLCYHKLKPKVPAEFIIQQYTIKYYSILYLHNRLKKAFSFWLYMNVCLF